MERTGQAKQRTAGISEAGSALLVARTRSVEERMQFMDMDRDAQDKVLSEMMMECSIDVYTVARIVQMRDGEAVRNEDL